MRGLAASRPATRLSRLDLWLATVLAPQRECENRSVAAVASVVRPRLALRAAPILAAAYAIALALTINRSVQEAFGYSDSPRALDLAAGLALLAAGATVCLDATSPVLGVLTMLAGAAWFAPDWETLNAGSTLVRSLGTALTPLFLVLLLHLVLVACGRFARFVRVGLLAAYALTAAVIVMRALFRDGETVQVGKLDIEQHDVRMQPRRLDDGRASVGRSAHDGEPFCVEQLAGRLSEVVVIVDDQDGRAHAVIVARRP